MFSLLVIVLYVYLLQVNLNSMLVVGWCALCCSFQRDDPVIVSRLKGRQLLHLRQMFGGMGPLSLSHSSFPLSLSLGGVLA